MKLEFQPKSRSIVLAGLVISIMAIFVVRLFYLQIIQHSYYVSQASSEQVKRLTIPAKRGLIYALDGDEPVPLVMNQTVYTVFADPQMVKNDKKIISVIKSVAGGNARADLQKLLDKSDSRYQILATKISRTQAEMIKKEDLSGIGFQEQTQRFYPEGALASQVLGFLDFDGVGQYGIEGKLNDRLTGKDGMLQSVTDVRDVPLTIGNNNISTPAKNGENIVLSIDRNIQSKVDQALADALVRTGGTKASAIVMDPQTGKIMAMSNLPTYKPAEYNKVEDASVFNNAVVSAPYEPGSDVKTLTMATGIDRGVVSADATYVNTDHIRVDDRIISNNVLGYTGTITFQFAMNWSLNTGFVTVAQRLGDGENITKGAREIMYDYFHNKFHLGELTGVEVDGEVTGTIISPNETEGNAVRYSNMAFGQGLDVTMVQMAAAFGSIVNGGKYYKPSVIAGTLTGDKFVALKPAAPTQTVSKSTADQVRTMTHITRGSYYGQMDKPGYYIGGKTGTSQVLKDGVYSSDETVATYLGYGGSETESNYVIMVQVSGEHKALQGSTDAMPIFTDISNWIIDYKKLTPKG